MEILWVCIEGRGFRRFVPCSWTMRSRSYWYRVVLSLSVCIQIHNEPQQFSVTTNQTITCFLVPWESDSYCKKKKWAKTCNLNHLSDFCSRWHHRCDPWSSRAAGNNIADCLRVFYWIVWVTTWHDGKHDTTRNLPSTGRISSPQDRMNMAAKSLQGM